MSLPRFYSFCFPGFRVLDVKEWLAEGKIDLFLESIADERAFVCDRCGQELIGNSGKYRLKVRGMPIMGFELWVCFWRRRGFCPHCRKHRAERIEFLAEETPHLTRDYAWWIGRLCEIAAVSRVAELLNQDETTTWRMDLRRMRWMLERYRIPPATAISVDEVYARKRSRYSKEPREKKFFTVISDLKSRRVIWVSEGRGQEALDQLFLLLGKQACKKVEVVATDQHDPYARSTKNHCPEATLVWDRFHLMKVFEEALQDARRDIHQRAEKGSELKRLTLGRYRFIFGKKASRRTEQEKLHLQQVFERNHEFIKLELIKERFISFFDEQEEAGAKQVFEEIGEWVYQAGFIPLIEWYRRLERNWDTLKNYFRYKVSTSLSEGINNVIKVLKRRAYGYRNMEYFRLKIMQVCGYLNSRYVTPGIPATSQ